MSISVTCPECQARIELADDLADQPIRCQRCEHTFDRAQAQRKAYAEGIQTRPTPIAVATRKEDDEPEPELSRPHPPPRAPFPWHAVLVIVIGILFFLLVFSIGFNVWFLSMPDKRFGR